MCHSSRACNPAGSKLAKLPRVFRLILPAVISMLASPHTIGSVITAQDSLETVVATVIMCNLLASIQHNKDFFESFQTADIWEGDGLIVV